MPIKGYSFDIPIPNDNDVKKMHMVLRNEGYAITYLNPSFWRVSGFGDVSGLDKSIEPKRKAYIMKSVAELFNPEA